jgi:hypothetical protein
MLNRNADQMASVSFFGFLADDVVLGAMHFGHQKLPDSESTALRVASGILRSLVNLEEQAGAPITAVHSIAPIADLAETLGVVRNASPEFSDGLKEHLVLLADTADAMVDDKPVDADAVASLRDLFDRIASLTLSASAEIVQPRDRGVDPWTHMVSRSSIV